MRTVSRRALLVVAFLLVLGAAYVPVHSARAALGAPQLASVLWGDSTAVAKWASVPGAAGYRVSLIRLSDMGVMLQKTLPASQTAWDAQGIWPGQQYAVAVEAIDASGAIGPATLSQPGQAVPISRSTYNGFLDTMDIAQGQIDTNLWDVRLGQDNPPNQGGTFINNQLHGHIEAGDMNGDQTFTSMRARVPFDFSGGRTLTVHGEVDLKGDRHNWFGATLSAQAIGGDQLIDLVDRPLEPRKIPQLELFTDQDGVHLFEALPNAAYEIGKPYTGGYHTNNVRDELLWRVSTSHVSVTINGALAFDANLPAPLPFTTGYLTLMAEDYPGNGGGVTPPSACDAVMADCNMWHLDNWGFDATAGVLQPASAVYYTSKCGPYPSAEHTMVTFAECQRLDNTGGYGFLSVKGQTATATFTLPSTFDPSKVSSAGLSFDSNGLVSPTRLSVSLNGGPFTAIGYVPSRTNSWQSFRIPLDATRLKAGANTITFRDSVAGSYSTPQVANIQLETLLSSAYSPPQLPPEPSPIGTWGGTPPTPTPSPSPSPSPTPSPTPTPISISDVPCVVTINGVQQAGTCSGMFTPSK